MNVVPGWFWLALLLATLVMAPAMIRRWHSMRGGRKGRTPHGLFETFYTVASRLWLPAAAIAVPLVYVARLLLF
jgi:hypothetical protein